MTAERVITIDSHRFDGNHDKHTAYKYDAFSQNLERILLACNLKDYSAVVDGTRYILNVDPTIAFWRNEKERIFSRDRPVTFNSYMFEVRSVRIAIKNIMSNTNKQDVWNMAWIVEYFIINGCNMRQVSIDEIYKLWKTNPAKLFGNVDEEQLSTIRKKDVVTS